MIEQKYAISKPIVIIASRSEIDFSKHQKLFRRNGMECLHVTERFKLIEESIKPSCFCVFMDDNFCEESLRVLKELKKHSKASWVYCLREQFGKTINHHAMAAGASLVLLRPKEPQQYLLRAKQMLAVFKSNKVTSEPEKPSAKMAPFLSDPDADSSDDFVEEVIKQEPIVKSTPHLISEDLRPLFAREFKQIKSSADYQERRPVWKGYASSYIQQPFQSLEVLRRNHKTLLRKIVKEAGDGALSLIGLHAESPVEADYQNVRVLLDEEYSTNFSKILSINSFPEIKYCIDQKQPVFNMNVQSSYIYTPSTKKENEMSIASLPILEADGSLLGIVRAAFPVPANLELEQFLEDLAAYTTEFRTGFRSLEFFSRVYSPDCHLYR